MSLRFRHSPLLFNLGLYLTYLVFCVAQRCVYFLWVTFESRGADIGFPQALVQGLAFDLITGSTLFLLTTVLLFFAPTQWIPSKFFTVVLTALTSLPLLLVFFMAVAEGFFFAEFHSRFNFIAVDYLVYSHEVIRNAVESYPLHWLFGGILLFWCPFVYAIYRRSSCLQYPSKSLPERLAMAALAAALIAPLGLIDEDSLISNQAF